MIVENKKVRLDDTVKSALILFSYNDYLKGFDWNHDNLMVIIIAIHNYIVKRILVDHRSLANILYNATIISMNISKVNLKPHNGNLISFSSKQVSVKGTIRLKVTLGMRPIVIDIEIDFLVIKVLNSVYNAILGRTSLNKVRAIVSTLHLLIKFLKLNGIGQVHVN